MNVKRLTRRMKELLTERHLNPKKLVIYKKSAWGATLAAQI